MIKKYILIVFLAFVFNPKSFSQWKYSKGKNDFDGNYKTATNIGKGYEFPYLKPLLVFNLFNETNSNFYIAEIGYTGCENNTLLLKFNTDKRTFYAYPSTDKANEILFISGLVFQNEELEIITIDEIQILEIFKKNQSLSIRFENDCTKRDFKFNIINSKTALDLVYNHQYISYLKALEIQEREIDEKIKKEQEVEEKIKREKKEFEKNKKLKENEILQIEKNKISKIEDEISIFNRNFDSKLSATKPILFNSKIIISDSLLFKYRFSKNKGSFDNSNKFGFEENEIIGFYNYFKKDSLKISRKEQDVFIHIFNIPFDLISPEFGYYNKLKAAWKNYEKDLENSIVELDKKYIEDFFSNYKIDKNRTDFDIKISTLKIDNPGKINLQESYYSNKYIELNLQKGSEIEILNDYRNFKIRVMYNQKIGYLDYYDLNKKADLKKIQPLISFWFNYYNK